MDRNTHPVSWMLNPTSSPYLNVNNLEISRVSIPYETALTSALHLSQKIPFVVKRSTDPAVSSKLITEILALTRCKVYGVSFVIPLLHWVVLYRDSNGELRFIDSVWSKSPPTNFTACANWEESPVECLQKALRDGCQILDVALTFPCMQGALESKTPGMANLPFCSRMIQYVHTLNTSLQMAHRDLSLRRFLFITAADILVISDFNSSAFPATQADLDMDGLALAQCLVQLLDSPTGSQNSATKAFLKDMRELKPGSTSSSLSEVILQRFTQYMESTHEEEPNDALGKVTLAEIESILLSGNFKDMMQTLVSTHRAFRVQNGHQDGNYLVDVDLGDDASIAMVHNDVMYMRTLGILTYLYTVPVLLMCTFTSKRPNFKLWFPQRDGRVYSTPWETTVSGAYHEFQRATGHEENAKANFNMRRKFPFDKHEEIILVHFTPQILDRILHNVSNPDQTITAMLQDLTVMKYIAIHHQLAGASSRSKIQTILTRFDIRLQLRQHASVDDEKAWALFQEVKSIVN